MGVGVCKSSTAVPPAPCFMSGRVLFFNGIVAPRVDDTESVSVTGAIKTSPDELRGLGIDGERLVTGDEGSFFGEDPPFFDSFLLGMRLER